MGFTGCLGIFHVIQSDLMVYSKKTIEKKYEEDVLELFSTRTVIVVN